MPLVNLQSSHTSDHEERNSRAMSEERRISQSAIPITSFSSWDYVTFYTEPSLKCKISLWESSRKSDGEILAAWRSQQNKGFMGDWLNTSLSSWPVSGKGHYTFSTIRAAQELLDESLKRKMYLPEEKGCSRYLKTTFPKGLEEWSFCLETEKESLQKC